MTHIDRALGILLQLGSGKPVSASALAERFGVSVRTIYRDIDRLALTGVPVYAERGVTGGYRLAEGFFLPPVAFTRAEAVALLAALALVRGLRVTPLAAELETAERKLVGALPRHLRPLLAAARRLIGFERAAEDIFHPERPSPPEAAEAAAVDRFLGALFEQVRIRLDYASPYGRTTRSHEVEPLGVLWDRDHWYLIGRRTGPEAGPGERERLWRADRVLAATPTGLKTRPDPDFDIARWLDRSWLAEAMRQWLDSDPVEIALSPAQAARLKRDWYYRHADYRPAGPDRVIMRFGADEPGDVLELLRWLGPGAELIAPAAWRTQARRELEAMLAVYQEA